MASHAKVPIEVAHARVRVCVIDLDAQSRKRLERVLSERDDVDLVTSGDAEIVVAPFDGRSIPPPSGRTWVLAVAASSALSDALDQGADDVLLQPFTAEEARARIAFALRHVSRPRGATPRAALAEALAHPRGGEVVVRVGDETTRIHVHEGRIVWVHRAGEPTGLSDVFPALDRREAAELTRTARETRRHFADVLVDRGRLDAAEVREGVRRFVEARLGPTLDADGAVALFAPGTLAYHAQLSFERREVARPTQPPPLTTRASGTVETVGREAWVGLVAALRGNGACSVAILDCATGVAVLDDGDDLDTAIAWGLARLITLDGAARSDVMLGGERAHVARALPGSDRFVVYVAYDDPAVNLALARHELAAALASTPSATHGA
ncbi:response regulator transcription factor [Sandaracinus amylolyticus]|uniref:Uncharacterized protein n=1 Tax=Sandaracinus amylolyticus TaxID=927083 RepID=A0A0F6WA33_9BACT|nr:response regulator transcription factor [Sandaracinus amylolyticus]AKF11208.1 hypothetical protein DB32_008357 [Sandaracinus amylolyticus]